MYLLMCSKESNLYLYFSCITANLTSFIVGYCFAWTGAAIPRLDGTIEPEYSPLRMTILPHHKTWIASIVPIGAAISAVLSGYLVDKRGRKGLLVISTLLSTLGLAVIYFSEYVSSIFIGRLLCGLGIGGSLTVVPLYLGEIAENQNRGLLGMFMGTFIALGMLVTYALSSIITLNELNLIFFVVAFIFLLVIDWWLPESPYWLLSQEQSKDAESSLRKIRKCSNEDLSNELAIMEKYIAESHTNDIDLADIFRRKDIFKALCITCGLAIVQQISGVSVILYYMQPIFAEINTNFPRELPAVIISLIQVLSCVMSSLFIDKLGRKMLLLISTMGSGLSLTALGVYFYLEEWWECLYWLSIVSVVCFMVSYAIGLGPVPFVILGEVFPHKIKAIASAITICICLIFAICANTIFMPLSGAIGISSTIWILAALCFIGGLFLYFVVPETKRRSLFDIQEMLQK